MKRYENTLETERRVYKRVPMKNSSFTCHVETENCSSRLKDLSLSGCCLEKSNGLKQGHISTVTFISEDDTFLTPLTLSTKVIRVGNNGVALEFLKTNESDYMKLQGILLYHSQEPHLMAIEFPERPHLAGV